MKPDSIFFFPNGMTGCCDENGNQIAKYQGRHGDAVKALEADGYDWKQIREIHGRPNGGWLIEIP